MDIEYKFNYRYNPKSNRLENYDYSENWWYFITICTKDRQEYFGKIIDGEMILNDIGGEIDLEIKNIPIFRKNVILDEYVIMPNHIHIILFLENNNCRDVPVEYLKGNTEHLKKNVIDNNMFHRNISTENDKFSKQYYSNISPKKWNLWNIIKLFKSFFTKNINKSQNKIYFAWQNNYYDRIIRNDDELDRIRKYIIENPLKWELEKDNEQWIFI